MKSAKSQSNQGGQTSVGRQPDKHASMIGMPIGLSDIDRQNSES
jgi:hypothetical protein